MKLWEVLKELEENPKKVFECDTGSRIKFFDNILHWYDKHGNPKEVFEIRDKRSGTGICDNTGDIWQEVKQPVPWQEAIDAFLKGKKVRCHINCNDFYYEKDKYESNPIKDNTGYHLTASELMHGEWYIED